MGSPFTITLASIFMWHWEQKLVEQQIASNELQGRQAVLHRVYDSLLLSLAIIFFQIRYIDDIFLTSNDSIERLQQMLNNANDSHPDIKLTYEIRNCISFLDLQIQNIDGQLQTSVQHKDPPEPYILPFKSDHLRHIYENIIHTQLLRDVRYCSTLQEFNYKQRTNY